MTTFNVDAVLEQANQLAAARLQSLGLNEEEYQECGGFVASFNDIAARQMLAQEPGIELQGSSEPIPLDDQTAMQALGLFSEGLIYSLMRCREYGVNGDPKTQILQQVALHIYEQAKQVVAATHGQEHTPEFQFTHDQQVEFITQGAESALLHFINEYEQQYGPLNPEPVAPLPTQPQPAEAGPDAQPPMAPAQPNRTAPASAPMSTASQPTGPAQHEKYAAVALLLTTLPANQRARMLNRFNPDEKELIAFYSYPQHVEQNLDVALVEAHLKKLRALFSKGDNAPHSAAYDHIARLAALISREKLLLCVKDERPVVQRYLASLGADATLDVEASPAGHFLPPRLEEILYRYLAKRLAPELEGAGWQSNLPGSVGAS